MGILGGIGTATVTTSIVTGNPSCNIFGSCTDGEHTFIVGNTMLSTLGNYGGRRR